MPDTKGDIQKFGLTFFWEYVLTDRDRDYVEEIFGSVSTGEAKSQDPNDALFLANLASRLLDFEEARPTARKLCEFAMERQQYIDEQQPLTLHFLTQTQLRLWWADRHSRDDAVEKLRTFANLQISLEGYIRGGIKRDNPDRVFLPGFLSYRVLAELALGQGDIDEAIDLCQRGKHGGWMGDWDQQIQKFMSMRAL